MNRRHWGEELENVGGTSEYHWMCGNFFKYHGPMVGSAPGLVLPNDAGPGTYLPRKYENLTVDGHSAYAMIAPRPVFANGGTHDSWEDQYGEYLAMVNANPVYQFLGRQGLIVAPDAKPAFDKAYISGDEGFRYNDGGHVDGLDYPSFIQFALKYLNSGTAVNDVTGRAAFFRSGYTVNTIQHTFTGTVQITNNSALPLAAPLYYVVTNLSSGVTLVNGTDTTADGNRAIALPAGLSSGQTATITVKFASSPGLIAPAYTASLRTSL
jgi:hypothetical protein